MSCLRTVSYTHLENQKISVSESDIDYIFLSHAHIDHSGLIPLIFKNGFAGKIYTTKATNDLCRIMLRDSAHIQEFEAEWRNRKAKRSGAAPIEPLYTMADAEGVLNYFEPVSYTHLDVYKRQCLYYEHLLIMEQLLI